MTKVLAVVLALFVPPFVYFSTLGERRQDEIERLDGEIAHLNLRLQQARAVHHRRDQFHQETERLAQELLKMRRILPAAIDMNEFRAAVERRATDAGVRLTKFQLRRVETVGEFQRLSIDAEVAGSAESITNFYERLSNMSRIVSASYVTIRPDGAGWRTGFVISTNVLPD
jgi:Tfp pilus assembly protein PilO